MDKEEIKKAIRKILQEDENLDAQSSYFIVKELEDDLWLDIQEETDDTEEEADDAIDEMLDADETEPEEKEDLDLPELEEEADQEEPEVPPQPVTKKKRSLVKRPKVKVKK